MAPVSLPPFVQGLLQPYAQLRLSAYDNVKLIRALLAEQGKECDCWLVPFTWESQQARERYLVRYQQHWLDCGWSNDYSAAIAAAETPSTEQLALAKTVSAPTLTLQQVSFMCMQYSHFDHC